MTVPVPSSSQIHPGRLGRATVGGGGERGRMGSGLSSPSRGQTPGEGSSLDFAAVARALSDVARARGMEVPGFRSPPRLRGIERSIRRPQRGAPVVAVSLRGRPFAAVVADMVEGVVVANRLVGPEATRARTALWEALAARGHLSPAAA